MKKEHNYTSPETSKAISKLGIKWKASAYWQLVPGQKTYILKDKLEPFKPGFPAYNITELGHMIPFGFFNEMKILKLLNSYFKVLIEPDQWHTYSSEAEARAHYLIHLISIGKIKVDEEQVQVHPSLPIPVIK